MTRSLEIGNTFACVLPRIWRLGRAKDTKFDMNVSKKILLNAAKCQGYSIYRFWVIKRRPTWEEKLSTSTQIRFNIIFRSFLGYTQGHCQVKPNKVYSSKQLTKVFVLVKIWKGLWERNKSYARKTKGRSIVYITLHLVS